MEVLHSIQLSKVFFSPPFSVEGVEGEPVESDMAYTWIVTPVECIELNTLHFIVVAPGFVKYYAERKNGIKLGEETRLLRNKPLDADGVGLQAKADNKGPNGHIYLAGSICGASIRVRSFSRRNAQD